MAMNRLGISGASSIKVIHRSNQQIEGFMYIILDPIRKKFWKQNKHGYCDLSSEHLGHFTEKEASNIVDKSKPGNPEHTQVAFQAFCFDFLSSDPERSGRYVLIYARSISEARTKMFDTYGDRWNFCYTQEEFNANFPAFMVCHDTLIAAD